MSNVLSESDRKAVSEILTRELAVEETQLTLDAKLEADLSADSLTIVQITLALEERFNLTIPDAMAERISTVGDVFEAVAELQESAERRAS